MRLTSEIADRLVALVRAGASGASAAAALDIPVEIYNNWLTSDPAFASRIEHADAEARVLAQVRLRDKSPGVWLKGRPKAVAKAPKPKRKPWDKQKISGLTSRQRRFVHEYIIDCNGRQAAIRAGYSKRCAAERASMLLNKPNVASAIEAHRLRLLARTDITAERTLRELAAVAYFDPAKLYSNGRLLPVEDMPEDARRALAGLEEEVTESGGSLRRVRFTAKMPAIDALMKHLGLYDSDNTRRLELTGKGGAPIEMNFDLPLTDEEKRAEAIEIAKILYEVGALNLPENTAQALTNGKANGVVK